MLRVVTCTASFGFREVESKGVIEMGRPLIEMPDSLLGTLQDVLSKTNAHLAELTIGLFRAIPYIPDSDAVLFCIESVLALCADKDEVRIRPAEFLFPEIPSYDVRIHTIGRLSNNYNIWCVGWSVFEFLTDKYRYPYVILTKEDFIQYFVECFYEKFTYDKERGY